MACVFKQIIKSGDGLGLQRRVLSLKNKTFRWGLEFFFVLVSGERVTEVTRCHVPFFLGLFCNKVLKHFQPTTCNKKRFSLCYFLNEAIMDLYEIFVEDLFQDGRGGLIANLGFKRKMLISPSRNCKNKNSF